LIRLARPVLGDLEAEALREVLDSGWLVQGKKVRRFEELLEERIGVPHAVACSSGTAALQLAIAALDLPRGSRVAIPAYTFASPLNAALLAGLEPVLLDVDPRTCNLRAEDVLALLDSDAPPALLIAIHQFGLPAPLDAVVGPAAAAGMHIIEDAACALGSTLLLGGEQRPAGTMGTMGCFSFHPRKVITTAEGGAVTTSDPQLQQRLHLLRNHGLVRDAQTGRSSYELAGWNLRMSDLHGALGVIQMGRLAAILADRKRIAAAYRGRLAELTEMGLDLPHTPAGAEPNWQSFVVRVPARLGAEHVVAALAERDIESTVAAQGLHRQRAYRDLPGCAGAFPGTDECAARSIALPTPPSMDEAQIDAVASALRQILS